MDGHEDTSITLPLIMGEYDQLSSVVPIIVSTVLCSMSEITHPEGKWGPSGCTPGLGQETIPGEKGLAVGLECSVGIDPQG